MGFDLSEEKKKKRNDITNRPSDRARLQNKRWSFFLAMLFVALVGNVVIFVVSPQPSSSVVPSTVYINKNQASDMCYDYIYRNVKNPSSVKLLIGGARDIEAPNGRTRIIRNFTAQNDFGAHIDYRANCLFDKDTFIEAFINRR